MAFFSDNNDYYPLSGRGTGSIWDTKRDNNIDYDVDDTTGEVCKLFSEQQIYLIVHSLNMNIFSTFETHRADPMQWADSDRIRSLDWTLKKVGTKMKKK